LLVLLALIGAYCGYAIIAESSFHHAQAPFIPGMQPSPQGTSGPERLLAQPAPAAPSHAVN